MKESYPRSDTEPVTELTKQEFVDLIIGLTKDLSPDSDDIRDKHIADDIMVGQAPSILRGYITDYWVTFVTYEKPLEGIEYPIDTHYTVSVGGNGVLLAERKVEHIDNDAPRDVVPNSSQWLDQSLEAELGLGVVTEEELREAINKVKEHSTEQ